MASHPQVYVLTHIFDDPRYEGFAYDDYADDSFSPRGSSKDWQPRRLSETWRPPKVWGKVRPFNDFPALMTEHALSQRAADALRDLLEPNAELLPFTFRGRSYFALNVTTVADVLDTGRSEIRYFSSKPNKVLVITRFEFVPAKVADLVIFRIPQRWNEALVTQRFVDRVRERQLNGFAFEKVWPLGPGVNYRKLYRETVRQRETEGLPDGQSIHGNAVLIEFPLSGAEPSATEQADLDRICDQLDEILIDMTSMAPQIGNVDSAEHDDAKYRLTLLGPDADRLIDTLQPWLTTVKWPGGLRVTKVYGHPADPNARRADVGGIGAERQ